MSPPSRFQCLSVLAVTTTLALASCGGSGNTGTPAANTSASASESAMAGHDHGATESGGLLIGDPMPARDDPNHPPDVTPQEVYAMGEKSVFSITGRRPDDLTVSGTGFLVDKKNQLAVTNAHVIEGIAATQGRFNAGTKQAIHIIASDPCTDLAVVHFSDPLPETAEAMVIGKAENVKPGDAVTVLGYPGSLTKNPTEQKLIITTGLVNATKVVARPTGTPEYKDTIQHSATINHGNSGGPLVDHHGRVVGINTLANTGIRGETQNQYYSISIDGAAAELTSKLLKGESQNNLGWAVEEYFPGYFETVDPVAGPPVDQQMAAQKITSGLYVRAVTAGSGPSKAGIKPGMLIQRMQSTSSGTLADMCDIVESMMPGSVAEVEGLYLLSDPTRFNTKFSAQFTVPGKH